MEISPNILEFLKRSKNLKAMDRYESEKRSILADKLAACMENLERGEKKFIRANIEKFASLRIPTQVLIEKKLVKYMKDVGERFHKNEANIIAKRWQKQIDSWLEKNNLTEMVSKKEPTIDRKKPSDKKSNQQFQPQLNGAWTTDQSSSDADYKQKNHSSSFEETDSPDTHKIHEKISDTSHRSDNNDFFVAKSFSPLQSENPCPEFNANLSIDPREIISSNKSHDSSVRPKERFYIGMTGNMFRAVKTGEPVSDEGLSFLRYLFKNVALTPESSMPSFLRDHRKNMGAGAKSLDCKNGSPSTSQQRKVGTSHCSLEEYRKRNPGANTKESKGQPQSVQDSKDLPFTSLDAATDSFIRSISKSTPDRKRKHNESTQSPVTTKDLKDKQSSCRNLPSMPMIDVADLSRTSLASRPDKKKKPLEGDQIITKSKELKELSILKHKVSSPSVVKDRDHQSIQNGKLKHIAPSQSLSPTKSKELREQLYPAQGKISNSKGSPQTFGRTKEIKDQKRPIPDSKLKLDAKWVPETRSGDKNNTKRRESPAQMAMAATPSKKERTSLGHGEKISKSPDNSAMIAITSSKKERTTVYNGGKKKEVPKLSDLSLKVAVKAVKSPDYLRYFNLLASFEDLEPVLVTLSPEKLYRLEEWKMDYIGCSEHIWKLHCDKKFKTQIHLKRENETWRDFYQRCNREREIRFQNVKASVSASVSKIKPDRQMKFIEVDGPPTKRQKTDSTVVAKSHINNSPNKTTPPNKVPSNHINSRSEIPGPSKATSNHTKPGHKTIKKDAPLMQKAKKTLDHFNRIHRN